MVPLFLSSAGVLFYQAFEAVGFEQDLPRNEIKGRW